MNKRTPLKALLTIGLALHIPSQAAACRIGWDQHLFEDSPAPDVLLGAQIIRVQFSNARPALQNWQGSAADPDAGYTLPYTLIGAARIFRGGVARGRPFPVYAFVTSCSGFHGMQSGGEPRHVVAGEYYLIGRFRGPRFYAGGVRVDSGGKPIYQGWHF
jgi:hypothetical protein